MPNRRGDAAVSDEAVKARTGKRWEQWFKILDRWGAKAKGHTATARYLGEKHAVSSWWSQSITVGYERARCLREVGQVAGGTLDVQRTVAVPRKEAYAAVTDPRIVSKWFTTKA